jgi:hypothetical protein
MNLRPVLIALAAGAALWMAACSPKTPPEADSASADAGSVATPGVPDGDPTTAADAQAAQDAAMAASPTANEVPVMDAAPAPLPSASAPASAAASVHAGH